MVSVFDVKMQMQYLVPFSAIGFDFFDEKNRLKIGATLNYHELGTRIENLFLNDFKFLTPANAAKQARLHPRPGIWQWDRI